MSSSTRILMYSQDSLGLGHLRRLTNLAGCLVAQRPELSVLLVVDSPVAPFFALPPNVDFVKLPTVVKVDAGVFRAGRLRIGYDEVRELRSRMLRDIVVQFAPGVLLVDHMPGGANGELLPALEAIRRRALPTRVVLGLRDIIDRPEVTQAVWQREGAYAALERHYHRVLIYGTADVFPTADQYRIAAVVGDRVRYCGYVCNMAAVQERGAMRCRLGFGDRPVVAVIVGGGADAAHLLQTCFEATRAIAARRPLGTMLITGPFLPATEREDLRARAAAHDVVVHASVDDPLSHIHAADVVVCMAGYNSVTEVLRVARRAIVVPRAGPSAEQGMRARLMAGRGLVDMVEPAQLAPATLAHAIEHALDAPPHQAAPLDLNGVANASTALLAELDAVPATRVAAQQR